jgi:hypothetical protein
LLGFPKNFAKVEMVFGLICLLYTALVADDLGERTTTAYSTKKYFHAVYCRYPVVDATLMGTKNFPLDGDEKHDVKSNAKNFSQLKYRVTVRTKRFH